MTLQQSRISPLVTGPPQTSFSGQEQPMASTRSRVGIKLSSTMRTNNSLEAPPKMLYNPYGILFGHSRSPRNVNILHGELPVKHCLQELIYVEEESQLIQRVKTAETPQKMPCMLSGIAPQLNQFGIRNLGFRGFEPHQLWILLICSQKS